MPLSAETGAPARPTTTTLRYRADIDGLRSLSILAVMLFHVGFSFIPGGFVGVDIFFVISGYLISSLLFAELDRTGRIDFVNFWARRTRRLMPSAILVIVVTLCVGWYILSDIKLLYAGRDAIFAAVYMTNWQKLADAISYFDDESGAGPFLHYWSLAVEEQFYLFLTLVFAGALWLRRRVVSRITPANLVIFMLITFGILSFIVNLVAVADAQPVAFFGTHARIWQLAVGAGVGLLERGRLLPGPAFRQFSAWAGLSMMVLAIALFSEKLSYPGLYALLPTVGAALFLFACIGRGDADAEGARPLPNRVLALPVPVFIGKISYALYLWHWPVFELYRAEAKNFDLEDQLFAILITVVLAILSYFTVENPIRFNRRLALRPIASLCAAASITALACGSALALQMTKSNALIFLANGEVLVPKRVQRDRPRIYKEKCHMYLRDVVYETCVYGQEDSDRKIFLVGDSHAAHWFPMLEQFAARHGYALYTRTKSACIGIDVIVRSSHLKREYHECAEWRADVMQEIEAVEPELVILGNSSAHRPFIPGEGYVRGEAGHRGLAEGEARTIEAMLARDIKVILMKDMPWVPGDPIDCLMQHPRDAGTCRWREDVSFQELRSPWSPTFRDWNGNVKVIDLSYRSCPDGYCYAASEDLVKMRDSHHLTATYAGALTDDFEREVGDFLDLANRDDVEDCRDCEPQAGVDTGEAPERRASRKRYEKQMGEAL